MAGPRVVGAWEAENFSHLLLPLLILAPLVIYSLRTRQAAEPTVSARPAGVVVALVVAAAGVSLLAERLNDIDDSVASVSSEVERVSSAVDDLRR